MSRIEDHKFRHIFHHNLLDFLSKDEICKLAQAHPSIKSEDLVTLTMKQIIKNRKISDRFVESMAFMSGLIETIGSKKFCYTILKPYIWYLDNNDREVRWTEESFDCISPLDNKTIALALNKLTKQELCEEIFPILIEDDNDNNNEELYRSAPVQGTDTDSDDDE